MAINKPTCRIGLMGPFGYGNLGDAAIVEAVVQNLRERLPGCELLGFTLDPRDTETRHGIQSFPLSRVSWSTDDESRKGPYTRAMERLRSSSSRTVRQVERVLSRGPAEFGMLVRSFRALDDVDLLVMTGSGQIQDYWGGGGAWSYPYTMLRWAVLARLRGTEFIVMSVGAGPVDSRLSRLFFRWALSLASYRSYRDEWSRTFVAEQIGFRRGDPVVADLAFSLTIPTLDESPDVEVVAGREKVVGIGPIGYYRGQSWPQRDDARWEHYLATMVEFVRSLLVQGHQVLFLKGEAVYDQVVIDDLVRELRASGVELRDRVIDVSIETVDDLVKALARCDVVVASRFHNVLLGYLLGRPIVGLSYQAKTDSLMAEFGQSRYCRPIGDAQPDELLELTTELLASAGSADQWASIARRKREELDVQYDRIFNER